MRRLVYTIKGPHDSKNKEPNYTKAIILANTHTKNRHILEYAYIQKRHKLPKSLFKTFVSTLVEMPTIYYDEHTITIKCKKLKFVFKLQDSIYTKQFLDQFRNENKLEKATCLLLKLSNQNIYWSESIHKSLRTKGIEPVNMLSCSISPIKSQFTENTDNEFACSFATFKSIPIEGTFYSIIDVARFPRLFQRILIHCAYAKLANSSKKLHIHIFTISKSDNDFNQDTLDIIKKHKLPKNISKPIDDLFTINNYSIVKLDSQSLTHFEL